MAMASGSKGRFTHFMLLQQPLAHVFGATEAHLDSFKARGELVGHLLHL